MNTELLDENVKTRVPRQLKQRLEKEAKQRQLKVADIAREALREYFKRREAPRAA